MSIGIDCGMGRTNINLKTGIRYGVISQHTVGQAWYDESTPDYGEPTCPRCGNAVVACDDSMQENEGYNRERGGCDEWQCDDCERVYDSQDVYPEEAHSYTYSGDGYELSNCLESDIIVTKSPYYTLAPYCSPCVPGACSLDSAHEDGAKAYCLGHDWFEDGKAPYVVFSVDTGEIVQPMA